MITSAIIWIIVGSACLCILLCSVVTIAWLFKIIKRLIWGKKKHNTVV